METQNTGISMRKVRRAIEGIDVPAVVAALVAEGPALRRERRGWATARGCAPESAPRRAVRPPSPDGVALVLNLQMLDESTASAAPPPRARSLTWRE